MGVTLESGSGIKRFRGLSSDEKPGRVPFEIDDPIGELPPGSVFTEIDTGERYIWGGTWPWVRQEQTIEAQFAELSGLMAEAVSALRIIQAATATVANAAWEADIPTGREN